MPVFKKYGEEAKVFQDFFPNLLHVVKVSQKFPFLSLCHV